MQGAIIFLIIAEHFVVVKFLKVLKVLRDDQHFELKYVQLISKL
jgi:hypothetical protein